MSKSRSAMRLLDTTTGEFVWVNDPRQRTYAILSHVWTQGPDGEQTYHDMLILQAEVKSARIANVKVGDNGRDVSRVWLENQGGDGGLSLQTRTVQRCTYSTYIPKTYRWRPVPSVIAHLSA